MKDKLLLKNGFEIELESGASLFEVKVLSRTKEEMIRIWGNLTEENLGSVSMKNGDGITVATYSNLLLVCETSILQENGYILTIFNLREKTGTEKRIEQLEKSAEVYNNAIYDLGGAVSNLAREGGIV
ncbi:MAG: hypothetical protein HFI03_14450 [Lachnospiraceae bacterium]|jgi:hypothetical protein|nr:hypothetical protein [Lachnospiraceae bacterium]